jgi:hypothetical protein
LVPSRAQVILSAPHQAGEKGSGQVRDNQTNGTRLS